MYILYTDKKLKFIYFNLLCFNTLFKNLLILIIMMITKLQLLYFYNRLKLLIKWLFATGIKYQLNYLDYNKYCIEYLIDLVDNTNYLQKIEDYKKQGYDEHIILQQFTKQTPTDDTAYLNAFISLSTLIQNYNTHDKCKNINKHGEVTIFKKDITVFSVIVVYSTYRMNII